MSTDGVLFLTLDESGLYTMRMYNTDGTQAEMCGNGIRCVARLVSERYIVGEAAYTMLSGGKRYPIRLEEPIAPAVESCSVRIDIATSSPDFSLSSEEFIGQKIEELDPSLRFTYLNLGNPHIVALCDEIDLEHLSSLGQRVKELPHIFPNGVNVSLIKHLGEQQIFVATFERGVGLTPSCGTAMTASCTAATLLGLCEAERRVEVRNRGGMVYCTTSLEPKLSTRLMGNATFEAQGKVSCEGEPLSHVERAEETRAWRQFVDNLNR